MTHTNAHRSLSAAATIAVALAIGLVSTPVLAADGPATVKRDPPVSVAPKQRAEPKPGASSAGLDDAARRALRASSPRPDALPRGQRMAMRNTAPAEDDPPPRRKSNKKPRKGDDDAGAPSDQDSRKIELDEEFLVEGKLEKPNAFYILHRSQSGYDWARLDAKFLPLVLESVQDPLF